MIYAVAIDDEPLALEVLAAHAKHVDMLTLVCTFTNAAEGLAYVQKNPVDVLFLDIKMPDKNGLEVALHVPPGVQVVFTTAYAEHAVTGFELNAADYLLKPVSLTRFAQTCSRVRDRMAALGEEKELFFKESGAWHKVLPKDLLYAEAQGNYLKLVMKDRTCLVRQTLYELEQSLPGYFARVHKSYIINTRKIDRAEPQQVTIGFTGIPVSERYRKDLFNMLGLKSQDV